MSCGPCQVTNAKNATCGEWHAECTNPTPTHSKLVKETVLKSVDMRDPEINEHFTELFDRVRSLTETMVSKPCDASATSCTSPFLDAMLDSI